MKMKSEDYATLKAAMVPFMAVHPCKREEYHKAGMSDARFAWDVLYASRYDVRELYRYLNASHIQTALLRIVVEEHRAWNVSGGAA